jgi:glycosyltransferase involved in cell wall biosynthesis
MKEKIDIVCIFNYASHYRENIYLKMQESLNCDFYFGNVEDGKIKKIDYSLFKKKVIEFKTITIFKNITWLNKSVSLVFKPYKKYIITGEYYSLSTWAILVLNKILRKKTYLWTHGWYGNEGGVKKTIKKMYFGLADGILLYGNYAEELMINEGFNKNKLHVIYNSLNYDIQLGVRKKLVETNVYSSHFNNDYPVIIFIGRLTKVKKLHSLIEAQKQLLDLNLKVNVIFVGDGDIKIDLEQLTVDKSTQNYFWFYGKAYDENEIGNLIYNADLCVSPGNVGLTAIHTLTYGTPVISHNNFPNQMPEFEVIDKDFTGDFFTEDSTEDMVFKIKNWLFNNKEKRKEVRESCFKVIDTKFNPYYQVDVFKNIMK